MEINRQAVVQSFLTEAEEGLAEMEQALIDLEARPDDRELIQSMFRTAHTVKGNASMLELDRLAQSVHTLEDMLELLRGDAVKVSTEIINLLLRAVDALRKMLPAAVTNQAEIHPAHEAVFARLAKEVSRIREAGPASSPDAEVSMAAGAGPTAPAVEPKPAARNLRVDIGKLDRMLTLTGEIAIAQGRLRGSLERMSSSGAVQSELLDTQREIEGLFLELQELVTKIRMVPVGPTFHRCARTVRDLAQKHGKLARMVVEGEDVELDTSILEHLHDPLTHMIRNAVDHGVEPPEVRRTRRKNPCGVITLRAYHESGNIVIQVADDGEGLDHRKIVARARSLGLLTDDARPTAQEIQNLLFQPGFSTAERVSDLSGRGVGLDVVRRNVSALRGSIGIESREGAGTTITIRLPLTLAVIVGFTVGVGDQRYVIPLDAVVECMDMPVEQHRGDEGGIINLRGEALPYLRLRDVFGSQAPPPPRESIVIVAYEGGRAGIAVDELLGEGQAVIKSLGKLFQDISGIAASTILGNGSVALILDVPTLVREAIERQAEVIGKA